MIETAQLCALTEKGSGLHGVQRELISDPRQGVAREVELLYVEAVDDVSRREIDVHVGVDRHHHFWCLRGLADDDGRGARVGELPTPLERVHVDRYVRRGRGDDLVFHDDGRGEESEDDDDRQRRVQHFERHVVLGLPRNVVALAAVTNDRVEDQQYDETTDDRGANGEDLPQVEGGTRRLRRALLGAEGRHGTAGESQCGQGECDHFSQSTPAPGASRHTLRGQGADFHVMTLLTL